MSENFNVCLFRYSQAFHMGMCPTFFDCICLCFPFHTIYVELYKQFVNLLCFMNSLGKVSLVDDTFTF